MQVRRARPCEAVALSELAVAAKQLWGYSPEDIERWRPLVTVTEDDIASKPAFVADVANAAAGFYLLVPSGTAWELEHLWVAPRFIRRGIGRELLGHAVVTARAGGASSVIIDAEPNAEAFYLACGATRQGAVPAPIASDSARVRPQLSLSCILHDAPDRRFR